MKTKTAPQVVYLKDYLPSQFLIDEVFLHFDLHDDVTHVKTILRIRRNPDVKETTGSLVLDGEHMTLITLLIDGKPLDEHSYEVDDTKLTIFEVPERFTLETEVMIKPHENYALSGLYTAKGNYCTQCEPHGFRRITYFIDRPDILSKFTTSITADKKRYPVLLANGNLIEEKAMGNGRHWVKWEDPSLKPCYLFALVAGDYEYLEDTFKTGSGRQVELRIYVEKGNINQTHFAMQSLKRAMRWDEKAFGREYDLDIYMIVAVSTFNMGAMENKGLNIFNDKYILAKPETATDTDYVGIESVIGHEYFHNWTGNRVTVRDWFQITLKEGLTIFRDQNFTADMTSKAVKRIHDANIIRTFQFLQDAGPMAHPILPDHYMEVNNFYTVTVYHKGAEVIRMMQTLLGAETFREAMNLYFERNDGCAVTVEEFVKAMEDASGIDLKQFRRWYWQAGTPVLSISDQYDKNKKTYTLTVKQNCPPTPEQSKKENLHIPLAVGLLDEKGHNISLKLAKGESTEKKTIILNVKKEEEKFTFTDVASKPTPSLLRNFSAPVKLHYPYTERDLLFLMLHDTDAFNRWASCQLLATNVIMQLIDDHKAGKKLVCSEKLINGFRKVLDNEQLDKALIAEMLTLPPETALMQQMSVVDVDALHGVRQLVKEAIAESLRLDLLEHYRHCTDSEYVFNAIAMGRRALKNICLAYLAQLQEPETILLCQEQFDHSNNMTDAMGALVALNDIDCAERERMLAEFYQKWQHESLVIDKWFSLQACAQLPDALQRVKDLMEHPGFDLKNPNRVRSLIDTFARHNHVNFHSINGEGYVFLADNVLTIDKFNPHVAARSAEPFTHWRKYDEKRQSLMREQLERIVGSENISKDLYEIVTKSLEPTGLTIA